MTQSLTPNEPNNSEARACLEKVKHTEQSAKDKIAFLTNVKTKPVKNLSSYKCDYCDGWHLTSTTPNEQAGTATCKTCGGSPQNHLPSLLDPYGFGEEGHQVEGWVEALRPHANTPPHSELAPQTTPSKADNTGVWMSSVAECLEYVKRYGDTELPEAHVNHLITTTLTQHNEALLAKVEAMRKQTWDYDTSLATDEKISRANGANQVLKEVLAIIRGDK